VYSLPGQFLSYKKQLNPGAATMGNQPAFKIVEMPDEPEPKPVEKVYCEACKTLVEPTHECIPDEPMWCW
jgi:hypothetical protein